MRTIYKYELNAFPEPTVLKLPEDSKPLRAAVVDHVIYLWVDHELDRPHIDYTFHMIGTGAHIVAAEEHWGYVGTVFQGPFVWHIYYTW